MFKFLFRRKTDGTSEVVPETQRETITRAMGEVNAILAGLDPKPRVTLDPQSGEISLELPEQMPDEALALPAPEEEAVEKPGSVAEENSETHSDKKEKAATELAAS